jgi:hypothetical protein
LKVHGNPSFPAVVVPKPGGGTTSPASNFFRAFKLQVYLVMKMPPIPGQDIDLCRPDLYELLGDILDPSQSELHRPSIKWWDVELPQSLETRFRVDLNRLASPPIYRVKVVRNVAVRWIPGESPESQDPNATFSVQADLPFVHPVDASCPPLLPQNLTQVTFQNSDEVHDVTFTVIP